MNQVKQRGTYKNYLDGDFADKIFVFESVSRNPQGGSVASKETGKVQPFPLSETIFCVGSVKEKNKAGQMAPRKIRYVPGEDSIYVDEQTSDKDFPKVKVLASLVNGRITIEGDDAPRLNFFMNWDINETKKDRDTKKVARFRLLDTSVMAAKSRDKKKLAFDVLNWCYTADFKTKIKPLASLYFTHEQMAQQAEDIRHNLSMMAEANPEKFQAILDNPQTERKITIKRAIAEGHVVVDVTSNGIAWAQNPNAFFSVAAPGVDPIEDFANKSKSGDGQKYYDAMYKLVNDVEEISAPAMIEHVAEVKNVPMPTIKSASESDAEIIIMINTALEKGLITKTSNNVWFKYKSISANSKEQMVEKLRSNPIALNILKSELGI